MFKKILVCLDGSKLAEQILPFALEQAKKMECNIILLQVIASPSSVMSGAGSVTGPALHDQIDAEVLDALAVTQEDFRVCNFYIAAPLPP